MDLSIIIVNWKSKDYLRKCLVSVLAVTYPFRYEIIVIDSASFDGCGEMLRSEFPQVRFIQSESNLGFAKANNLAFEASSGEVILFLNPDTEVVGAAIIQLYNTIQSLPQAGAVGGRLLNTDGTLQTSCVQAFPTIINQILNAESLRRMTPRARLWGMQAIWENRAEPAEVEMISGACLIMRRSVFDQVGLFSTDYFMYAEDMDLCYKAHQAGFKNYYDGRAQVIHHGGGSSQQAGNNFSNVMMVESISRFLRKSRGRFYSHCYRWFVAGSAFVRMLILLLLAPVLLLRIGAPRWRGVYSKWLAVCVWGLGRSPWCVPTREVSST